MSPTDSPAPGWLRGLPPLVAIASHLTAIGNGFTWLDHGDLEHRAAIAAPSQWLTLFTHGFARTGFYRPLTALSLSIDALAGAPWAFHLTSVVLHALVALALVFAGEALGLQRKVAVLGGLLFAVHPVTSLVADQISFRGDLLVAAALLGLLAAHLRGNAWVAAGLLLLAGLSKETGGVLGPLWLAALAVAVPRPRRAVWIAEGLAWSAAVGMRLAFAPAWRSKQPELSFAEAIGTRLASVAKSAEALVVPPGVCDAIAIVPPWAPAALAGLALVAALGVLAWRQRPLGLLLLCAGLPSLNLIAAPRFWSPHYLYLPWAIAALLLAGWVVQRRWLAVGLVIAGVGASLWDGRRFVNDEALFAADARRPECREAQLYFGDARREAGDLAAAAGAYQLASAPSPGFLAYADESAAFQNLGLVRLAQADHFEAELAFSQALERATEPSSRDALTHDLAAVAVARGDPAAAVELLEPLTSRPDAPAESIALLAKALHDIGDDEGAKAQLERLRR